MTKNECEGCSVYPIVGDTCYGNVLEGCPCKNCIIKTVCGTNCDDLNDQVQRGKAIELERRSI